MDIVLRIEETAGQYQLVLVGGQDQKRRNLGGPLGEDDALTVGLWLADHLWQVTAAGLEMAVDGHTAPKVWPRRVALVTEDDDQQPAE